MKILLVELTPQQIKHAKAENGERKRITHAVVCWNYGQIFGTEAQCRKYYSAWEKIFPALFDGGLEVKNHDFSNYESTFNLVNKLIAQNDELEKASQPHGKGEAKTAEPQLHT